MKYIIAFILGLIVSIIVAVIEAVIGINLETEYLLVIIIGVIVVGQVVKFFTESHNIGGAIIGGVLCAFTNIVYQFIMAYYGYDYEDNADMWFWLLLIGSFIYGAYVSYVDDDEDDALSHQDDDENDDENNVWWSNLDDDENNGDDTNKYNS